MPVRFLEERFICVIGGFVQLKSGNLNQEELKPETEAKALVTSSWSLVLHEDSTNMRNGIMNMSFKNFSI